MDPQDKFTFSFQGIHEGKYCFRAPTWKTACRRAIDAQQFESAVTSWLLKNLDDTDWHLGNGNVGNYPNLPQAFETGSALCLLLRRVGDVVRFEQQFRVSGLSPAALLPA